MNKRGNFPKVFFRRYRKPFLHVAGWMLAAVEGAVAAAKSKGKQVPASTLVLVLARISYWLEPRTDDSAQPRAGARHRYQDADKLWWVVLSPSRLGEDLNLARYAVQRAVDRLAELGLVEVMKDPRKPITEDDNDKGCKKKSPVRYGPNGRLVRLRTEGIIPLVRAAMGDGDVTDEPSAKKKQKKKGKQHHGKV